MPIPATAKPVAPIKPRISRKAPSIKSAVIIQRTQGRAKSHIAKDLGIAHNTVTQILREADVEAQLSAGQTITAGLIPKALRVIEHRLDANSENAAIKLLESTIWPLQERAGRAKPDTILNLAISNLIAAPQPVHKEEAIEIRGVSDSGGGPELQRK